jgi:uncharacterized protein YggE
MRRVLLPLLIAGLLLAVSAATMMNFVSAAPAAQGTEIVGTATPRPQGTTTATRARTATATRTRVASATTTAEMTVISELTSTPTGTVTATAQVTATETPEVTGTVDSTATPTITVELDPPVVTGTTVITASVLPPEFANPQNVDEARTLEVIGRSDVIAEPDVATMTLAVDTIGVSVEQMVGENQEILADVREAIEAAGVPNEAVRVRPYAIAVEAPGDAESARSYRVSRQLTVRIENLPENLEVVQEIIDRTGEVGTAIFRSISYGRSDDAALRQRALREAVEDALSNARDLATLTGVEVVGVASVSEVTDGAQGTMPSQGGSDFSLLTSTVNYGAQVRIVFYIR